MWPAPEPDIWGGSEWLLHENKIRFMLVWNQHPHWEYLLSAGDRSCVGDRSCASMLWCGTDHASQAEGAVCWGNSASYFVLGQCPRSQCLEITLRAEQSSTPSLMWPADNSCHVTVSNVLSKSEVQEHDCSFHGNPMGHTLGKRWGRGNPKTPSHTNFLMGGWNMKTSSHTNFLMGGWNMKTSSHIY